VPDAKPGIKLCILFLSQGGQGYRGAWVWIGGEDAERLLEEYRATGAKICHLPTNHPWALEMQVEDLDGNILRIGSEPRTGEPTGEWLDMDGHILVTTPAGGWERQKRP
jgi:hypothetical protein